MIEEVDEGDGFDSAAGGGTGLLEPGTMRGRDWACLRQFSVFLENRVGNLTDLMRTVEGENLRVMGLSIQDSVDCAVARLIVDDYERAHQLFDLSDHFVFEADVIGVRLPDTDMPVADACRPLLRAELNIHYAYPLLHHDALVLYVDDVDKALEILENSTLEIVTEKDLKDDFGG